MYPLQHALNIQNVPCHRHLQQATQEAYALALAELAAAARSSNPCLAAAHEAEKKPARRQQLEKVAGGMFKAALVTPFVEAAVAGNKVCLRLWWRGPCVDLTEAVPVVAADVQPVHL